MTVPRLGGLLLAGGASRRFGSDKALARVEGATLLDRGVACLRAACDGPVLVAGGNLPGRDTVADGQVADLVPDAGPLSAIAAGLEVLAETVPRVAVLAVDHVDASPDLFGLLAAQGGPWSCVLTEVDGRRQPLHAVWATAVAPALVADVLAGHRSVLGWLADRDDVLEVPGVLLDVLGIGTIPLRDADTPDDLPA